jgi:hypothetical protein
LTKSNGTHSTSERVSKPVQQPWEVLLSSQATLGRLREFHHSSLWDSLRQMLEAERLFHLERLAEVDDSEREAQDHRVIARYLKHFMEYVPAEVEASFEAAKLDAEGKVEKIDAKSGGTPWMESDGDPAEGELD